jgi:cytosine/adenosine deaminase-related metal-dependent hydrolase
VLCYQTTAEDGDAGFEAGLAENERLLGLFPGANVRAMVGGQALDALSDAHLARLAALAAAHQVAVHLHVGDAAGGARHRGAAGDIARLAHTGVLDGLAVLAQTGPLAPGELDRLGASRAYLVRQPRASAIDRVGCLGRATALGPRLALGTDGICADVIGEAQAAFCRLRDEDAAATAAAVWAQLAGGWRLLSTAFGLLHEHGFGWLKPGAPADAVVLDYDSPTPVDAANLPWHLLWGIGARHVRDVIVGAEIVVRNRRLLRIDQLQLRAEAMAGAERLWGRVNELDQSDDR